MYLHSLELLLFIYKNLRNPSAKKLESRQKKFILKNKLRPIFFFYLLFHIYIYILERVNVLPSFKFRNSKIRDGYKSRSHVNNPCFHSVHHFTRSNFETTFIEEILFTIYHFAQFETFRQQINGSIKYKHHVTRCSSVAVI